jgi:hypothetical protein
MDGPVVKTAKKALETGNINLILPWAPKRAENEIKNAFERTLRVRKLDKEASDLADYWFFETVVRLHRDGEGAPYTGLKPAGLDWGPIVPKAEEALEKGDAKDVIDFLLKTVEEELQERFNHAMLKKNYDENDIDAAREYIHSMLGFVLYSQLLCKYIKSGGEH